jgi:hypothetical protein
MSGLPDYDLWITCNVEGNGYGKCREACHTMATFFPELKLVRGHYYCPSWGKRDHWWLVDPNGTVIDQTKMQFPSMGQGRYEPWDEAHPEPTGKCMNCGEYCYNDEYACSEDCRAKLVEYYNIRSRSAR